MLCLRGFELYSRWVPWFCSESQPKETYVHWAGEKDYQVKISSCLDPQEKKKRHLLIFWVQKSHLHLQPISDSITVTNTYWTRMGSVCAGDEIEANNEGGSPGNEIFFGEILIYFLAKHLSMFRREGGSRKTQVSELLVCYHCHAIKNKNQNCSVDI